MNFGNYVIIVIITRILNFNFIVMCKLYFIIILLVVYCIEANKDLLFWIWSVGPKIFSHYGTKLPQSRTRSNGTILAISVCANPLFRKTSRCHICMLKFEKLSARIPIGWSLVKG